MRRLLLLGALVANFPAYADDLMSIYKRAVMASPELSSSEFAVDIARAQEDQAFGQLLPNISVSGNYSLNRFHTESTTWQNTPNDTSTYAGKRATLTARQPLFDAQAYLLMKSQEAQTSQKEEELLAANQKLIADLVERYLKALELNDEREIMAAQLESTEKQLERVESLQARQLALITDLYEIQANTETLRTKLIDSENEANIALEKLRELTGDKVTNIQPVRLDFNQMPPQNTIESWVQEAGRLNPELNALNHAVDAARKSITGYQAGHLPRIDLQVTGIYTNTTINGISSSRPYEVGTLSVEATLPLYQGGITSAKVREAEGKKGLNEARREQKLRELEQLTRAAYLEMASSPAHSKAADRQLEAHEKSRDAMIEGYELGVVTIVDLLEAEKQLSEARRMQRQARYRYIKAYSTLLFQAGRLHAEELLKINSWLVAAMASSSKKQIEEASDVSQRSKSRIH